MITISMYEMNEMSNIYTTEVSHVGGVENVGRTQLTMANVLCLKTVHTNSVSSVNLGMNLLQVLLFQLSRA